MFRILRGSTIDRFARNVWHVTSMRFDGLESVVSLISSIKIEGNVWKSMESCCSALSLKQNNLKVIKIDLQIIVGFGDRFCVQKEKIGWICKSYSVRLLVNREVLLDLKLQPMPHNLFSAEKYVDCLWVQNLRHFSRSLLCIQRFYYCPLIAILELLFRQESLRNFQKSWINRIEKNSSHLVVDRTVGFNRWTEENDYVGISNTPFRNYFGMNTFIGIARNLWLKKRRLYSRHSNYQAQHSITI